MTTVDYGKLMGWPVLSDGAKALLRLPSGWVGITTTPDLGATACRHPVLAEACGPVLAMPGRPELWVFLAEADGEPLSALAMPAGVGLVRPPHAMLLPPSATKEGQVRWAVEPQPDRRWLPTTSTVLAAIANVVRSRQVSRPRTSIFVPRRWMG